MLISRKEEQRLLLTASCADESQFIAVYGRRRVGKTYLVRETFNNTFTFQHSGLAKGTARQQLQAFADSLEEAGLDGFGGDSLCHNSDRFYDRRYERGNELHGLVLS